MTAVLTLSSADRKPLLSAHRSHPPVRILITESLGVIVFVVTLAFCSWDHLSPCLLWERRSGWRWSFSDSGLSYNNPIYLRFKILAVTRAGFRPHEALGKLSVWGSHPPNIMHHKVLAVLQVNGTGVGWVIWVAPSGIQCSLRSLRPRVGLPTYVLMPRNVSSAFLDFMVAGLCGAYPPAAGPMGPIAACVVLWRWCVRDYSAFLYYDALCYAADGARS